ncbi:hypothetical protein C3L33_13591, partial [Rhododendron williamsianum]
MTEVKDPAIKLFGKTIPLPPKQRVSVSATPRKENCDRVSDEEEDGKTPSESKLTANRQENDPSRQTLEELKDPETSCDNPKTPSVGKEPDPPNPSKAGDQSETSISQEKTLKKPDKILLARVAIAWKRSSATTTTTTSVSRAISAKSASVSDCLQAARANGTILSFGADSQPFCESIALKPLENFQLVKISISGGGRREKGDDDTSTKFAMLQGSWPLVFSLDFTSVEVRDFSTGFRPLWISYAKFSPTSLLGLYYSTRIMERAMDSPSSFFNLGETFEGHVRERRALYESDSERGVWTPKTLRLDLNEAAKSSVWSNLGIKNKKNDSTNAGGGLFKAFHSKGEEKTHAEGTYLALQANPAALSRSFKFRESVNEC